MQSLKGLSGAALATDTDIRIATRRVAQHSYKYSRGRVLIIADGVEWRGAAVMAAYAANNAIASLRTATGFVTVAAPKELVPLFSKFSPVFVLKELAGNDRGRVSAVDSIRHDATVVGPGIQSADTRTSFLEKMLKSEEAAKRTVVLDAGVLGALAKKKWMITANTILTPHDGEFKALTGVNLKGKGLASRIKAAKDFVKKHDCTLVLKGHETIIADRERVKVNMAKSPALATMGSGDVLCGMIASYAAQHSDLFESAVAGVHAHSLIGDALFRKKGMHIIATDIIDAIPDVLKRFDRISKVG